MSCTWIHLLAQWGGTCMNIALVDDNAADLEAAGSLLREYIDAGYSDVEICIETFADGESLMEDFAADRYDLILLDIYMKGITGMETARAVRGIDPEVAIVFLTSSGEHVLEGYRVYALGYFIKPLEEHRSEFAETLDYLFPRLLKRQRGICLWVDGTEVSLPYREIYYMEIGENRSPAFHLSGRILSTSMAYEECRDALLKDSRFLECHHRIIVNMDWVESMEQEDFVMKDGALVPISRRRRQEVKIAYMNHIVNR